MAKYISVWRWFGTFVCCLFLFEHAEADWGLCVQNDEQVVMAVCREQQSVVLTELLVQDANGLRVLGFFIGRPSQLSFTSKHQVQLVTTSLGLPVMGVSVVTQRVETLVSDGVWEIHLRDGRVQIATDSNGLTQASGQRLSANQVPEQSDISTTIFAQLGQAYQAATMAYYSAYQWDFKQARERYRRSAKSFERLLTTFSKESLVSASVVPYIDEMTFRSRLSQEESERWVCGDHFKVIGDLLLAYRSQHEGFFPEDQMALVDWINTQSLAVSDPEVLASLFRSPADPEADRQFGYIYRANAALGEAMLTSRFYPSRLIELVRETDHFRVQDREIGQAQLDSLLALGVEKLESDPVEAVAPLEILAGVAPNFAQGHNKLGFAYLKVKNIDRAIQSFDRAVDCDYKLAEAYYGLGWAYKQRPKALYDAVRYFVKALQYDQDYIDARFYLAELRLELGEHDARDDAKKVIALDPTYAPAYFLLGRWNEEKGADFEQAAFYYAQYMALRPDDPRGPIRLGKMYTRSKRFDKVLHLLEDYANQHPDRTEVLPILAQACMKLKQTERADVYFTQYLASLPENERAIFEDIRLMTSASEYEAFTKMMGQDRDTFLTQFWAKRDPNLTSSVNERQLEHYRRVWYAQLHFSKKIKPWDQRGEVYVRFGEPDYRSRSDEPNFEQSLAVQRVKERLAMKIYGSRLSAGAMMNASVGEAGMVAGDIQLDASPMGATYPGPVYPVRSLRTSLGDGWEFSKEAEGEDNIDALAQMKLLGGANGARDALGVAFRPVTGSNDGSMVAWESWVYVDVGGGIEITFTDESGTGAYGFAPVPDDGRLPANQLATLTSLNSQVISERAAHVLPNHYVTPSNRNPLGFFYDLADFKSAQDGMTALEVYTAISHSDARVADPNKSQSFAIQSVAALNVETGEVYRAEDDVFWRGQEGDVAASGSFVLKQARLDVPPGTYRFEVEVREVQSDRKGQYRQDVVVERYADTELQVSDLALSWQVTETDEDGPFVKNNLQVVPLPTRTYPTNHGIFVYYEVYNLQRDDFGQTKYQVEYTIRAEASLGNIISRLARTITGKGQQEIGVGYEQVGQNATEANYVELDLSQCRPGQHRVWVEITDLVSGEKVVKDAGFTVKER